ncbi:hypothetical protein BM1_04499 [Bipolaris maydis]|nr:hypothetical protein BM1_04499 [Bipolaris maydis]KAJ5027092.1 hypothetical protein J3E73DRAFT_256315 [Bipolaris maydis]KAJ6271009.1 hypothetical protein PSV08DRAFT_247683 [Bipolaris maydis]KAJ6278359.1 hypothetical protein J3E71DRAFT_244436 [Bipolaris maydis]
MARSAQLESNLDAPLPRPVLHVYTAHPRLGTSSGPACTTNRQSAALALGPSADPRLQKAHPHAGHQIGCSRHLANAAEQDEATHLMPPRSHLDLPHQPPSDTGMHMDTSSQVNPRTGKRHATIGPPTPQSRQICPSYLRFALIQVPAQERVEWENCCKNLV